MNFMNIEFDDVYLAIRPQIDELGKTMKAIQAEILAGDGKQSLTEVVEKVRARGVVFGMTTAVIISMLLTSCGTGTTLTTSWARATAERPAVSTTIQPPDETAISETPFGIATQTVEATASQTAIPSVTTSPTSTEVVVRTEFAVGEFMTPEEIKKMVDWFKSVPEDELNQLTQGKLWSFSTYKGDSRPRDKAGKILSEAQDLGYLYTVDKKFSQPVMELELYYYNAMYLGTTTVESDGMVYYVGAFGMKTPDGKRIMVYGVQGLKEMLFPVGSIAKVDAYGRSFGSNNSEPVDQEEYIRNLLNKHQKDVVMIQNTEQLSYEGTPNIDVQRLNKLIGDNRLYDLMMKQYRGEQVSPEEYFDTLLGVREKKLKTDYTQEELKNFAVFDLVMIGE